MTNGAETPQKKGLGTLAWIGIGCGALLVVVLIVFVAGGLFVAKKVGDVAGDFEANPGLAAARLAVRFNPEWEEVSVDEGAGTITIRNTKTGEEITASFDDIQEGRFTISSDDGELTFDSQSDGEGGTISVDSKDGSYTLSTGVDVRGEIPGWVPPYPGVEVTNRHAVSRDDGSSGGFQLQCDDPVGTVLERYRSQLAAQGFAVQINTFAGDGEEGGMVTGQHEASGRSMTVMVQSDEGTTNAAVSYSEKS